MCICIAPRREHTSKALRYGTRSQGISQFYLHTPRSSASGMNHTCLCLPSRSWYSFTHLLYRLFESYFCHVATDEFTATYGSKFCWTVLMLIIITLLQPTYFRLFSPVSARATPLKLLFCPYFLTFFWPSTVEIWQHWSFWISLLHLTRSTMTSCSRDSGLALASTALLSGGFSLTWLAELSTSVVV